jgi:hypothetical protein
MKEYIRGVGYEMKICKIKSDGRKKDEMRSLWEGENVKIED